MKKFIVLYKSEQPAEEMIRNTTEEQRKQGTDLWMQWASKAGDTLVDLGTPLGNGRSIAKTGTENLHAGVSGYSIMQGESMETIRKLLEEHPHFMTPGKASIEVYETLLM
jgi:hypothetical protein